MPIQTPAGAVLKQLDISLAGLSDLSGSYRIGRFRPNWHVLIYTLAGSGLVRTQEGLTRIKRGSVLLLPRFTSHEYRPASSRWEIMWFHLRPMETWRHLESRQWSIATARYSDLIHAACTGFLHESFSQDQHAQRAAGFYAQLIALYLQRELAYTHDPRGWQTREHLRRLLNEVNASLQEEWSVAKMARRTHMSEGHFHRIMKELYGTGPMQKVTELRLQRAESLLQNTELPAYTIAEQVGYSNPFAFSTAFKRFYGRSPQQARGKLNKH